MAQATSTLEFKGTAKEQALAQRVFDLMAQSNGPLFARNSLLRQSLANLAAFLSDEEKASADDLRTRIDAAVRAPGEDTVTAAALATAEAKVLTTEVAIEATNRLFELAGTRSTLAEHNLDRYWRNARVHTLHDPVRRKYFHIGNYELNSISPPRHPWN